MTVNNRRLVVALAAATAGLALAAPADAQLAGGRAAFDQRLRAEPVQFREFFGNPFWGDGGGYSPHRSFEPFIPFHPRPQPPAESVRPPPPRKVEIPPTETVIVIGDALAEWLAYGLEETFADTPEVGIVRKIRPYSGLVRYDTRPDASDWSQAIKDVLATEKPAAIVIMLGVNDRLPLREGSAPHLGAATQAPVQAQGTTPPAPAASDTPPPDGEQPPIAKNEAQRRPPGGIYEFHTDRWAELYSKRIDDMIVALKNKGVPVFWVGIPAIRGAKSTSDMSYLDELYRARADKAGIAYVDVWDGFVDEQGRYAQQGPDFEGQTRRLRTYDGVHFTKSGAEKLAHYVEHDLRRVLTSHVLPVALPGPEEQPPAKGARPAIGPIVPLGSIGGGEDGELLGATNHPAQKEADPDATRVLSRGEAIAAPAGRADDFSWPRADANANGAVDVTPASVMPSPVAPAAAKKGAVGKAEPNNIDAAKANANKSDAINGEANKADTKRAMDAKRQSAPPATPQAVAPAKPRQPRAELDGAPPRPPMPVGPAAVR
jgi:uncharacterized protein